MSSTGYRRAELERQRKEQLRLQQLRQRATGLLASCQETIRAVTDPAVQQLVAKDLQKIQKTLAQTSSQISSAPEQANKQLKKTQKHLNKVITNAKTAVKKWSKKQARARAELEAVQQQVVDMLGGPRPPKDKESAPDADKLPASADAEPSGNKILKISNGKIMRYPIFKTVLPVEPTAKHH